MNFKVMIKDKFTDEIIEEYKPLTFEKGQDLKNEISWTLDFEKYYVEMRSI